MLKSSSPRDGNANIPYDVSVSPCLRGRCSAGNLHCTVIALLLAGLSVACNQKPHGGAKSTLNPLDRVDAVRIKPINFLHKTFTVRKYAQFLVEVPPHTVIPRIHGTFQSFVPQPGGDNLSDDSTDVSFLLMNPTQFAEYARGNGGATVLYTVEPTHDHEVEFALPPTNDVPEKYYVVFVNEPGGRPVKSVTADFSLSFGY